MKLIITGAGGLLGHRLAAAARRAGHETLGLGRTAQPPAGLACDHWLAADLAEPVLPGLDWAGWQGAPVFHLAADTRVYDAGRDFTRDNLATTATACAIARRTGGRIVFFSSAAVYSGPRTCHPVRPLRESDETHPAGGYGRSKVAAEEQIRRAAMDAVVLRLFGVLGERLAALPDRGNLVQAILRSAATGAPVTVATDGHGEPLVRDYVLDDDVCRVALAALDWTRPASGPLTVNLCTGQATSTAAMVALAGQAGGIPLSIRRSPSAAAVNPVMLGDPSQLRRLLGWIPENRTAEFWSRILPAPAPVPGSS